MLGIDEIGIGVMTAEIGQRHAIDDAALGGAERVFENGVRIGAGDRRHRVEFDRKTAAKSGADAVEVEQRLHQRAIILHAVDDLDAHVAELRR